MHTTQCFLSSGRAIDKSICLNDCLHQHDLTFCAQSCTAHQMEIFAQEFEPASYFCDWTCVHLGMRRQKSPKFDFQSQFSMSKISFIILIFVSVKIIRLGVQLMIYQFLITSFFEVVYFLKLGPIFVASYPSERKSNHKNNQLAQILGQKSPFGGLCNFVRKK